MKYIVTPTRIKLAKMILLSAILLIPLIVLCASIYNLLKTIFE